MENTLGKRIREMREKRGFTQEQLADYLNMQPPNISNYERGKSTPPIMKLEQIASILGTTTDYLLGKTNNPWPVDESLMNAAALLYQWADEAIEYFFKLFDGEYPFFRKMMNEVFEAISTTAEDKKVVLSLKINVSEPIDFELLSSYLVGVPNADFKLTLSEKLKSIAKKYHLWEDPRDFSIIKETPASNENEKEFLSKIDLSDEELLAQFKLTVDGRDLTQKEVKKLLAFLRMERNLED
ncbi:helix-turn-helix domain-containing protein [Brevibacillus reuszeri]|uniref:helix-turn-helix domain-containing protein n=1 Tax=Brevibacillus reuszeri TaxID=54915 RepID=UPI003D1E4C03